MKRTGIVRKVDELGRIVLPKELRRTLEMEIKDPVEIYTENDTVIVKKFKESCTFCGSVDNLGEFHGKSICSECMSELKK